MRFLRSSLSFFLALLAGSSCCRLRTADKPVQSCRGGLVDFGIPEVIAAPSIDGQPGDPAWERAICLQDFTAMDVQKQASANSARAWVCRDQNFLYLALLAEHDSPEHFRSMISEHDGPVWEDDDFEVFLDPGGSGLQYYHILANTNGAIHDHFVNTQKHDFIAWDSGAVSKGSRTEQSYYIELAIPLLSLNQTENLLPVLGLAIGRGIPYCRDFKKVLGRYHQPSTWTRFPLPALCRVQVEDYTCSIFEGESPFSLQLRNLQDHPVKLSGSFNGKAVQIHLQGKSRGTLNTSTFQYAGKTSMNELVLKDPAGQEVLRWYRVTTPLELLSVYPLSDLLYRGEDVRLAVTINEKADSELQVFARSQEGAVLEQIRFVPDARQFFVSLPFPAAAVTVSCHYKKASKSFDIQTIAPPWSE